MPLGEMEPQAVVEIADDAPPRQRRPVVQAGRRTSGLHPDQDGIRISEPISATGSDGDSNALACFGQCSTVGVGSPARQCGLSHLRSDGFNGRPLFSHRSSDDQRHQPSTGDMPVTRQRCDAVSGSGVERAKLGPHAGSFDAVAQAQRVLRVLGTHPHPVHGSRAHARKTSRCGSSHTFTAAARSKGSPATTCRTKCAACCSPLDQHRQSHAHAASKSS